MHDLPLFCSVSPPSLKKHRSTNNGRQSCIQEGDQEGRARQEGRGQGQEGAFFWLPPETS